MTGNPAQVSAYRPPRHPAPIDLDLSGGERSTDCARLEDLLAAIDADTLRCYPKSAALEQAYAQHVGQPFDRVYATAGADEAIDRLCRAFVSPGGNVVCPWPCFEMIPRYVALAGGELRAVEWAAGEFPVSRLLEAVDARTQLVVIVTPSNPTGGVATEADIERVAGAVPHATVLVDLAYGEFADGDLTATALRFPNVVVTRTLSKAWGLAGLRVGFALGQPDRLALLRAAGGPYSVSGPALAVASRALECGAQAQHEHVVEVRRERVRLEQQAHSLGWSAEPSQGNFVLWRGRGPQWLRDGLAGLGIGVRIFPDTPALTDAVRITCPGEPVRFRRLETAVASVLAPQAVLFDMDGVLADVSQSYRAAIVETARSFGIELSAGDVEAEKLRGDANDDWALTHRLVAARGGTATLAEVTARFEALYQGTNGEPGFRARERLIPSRAFLERLRMRVRTGIVTGRPRQDAFRFLRDHGIEALFDVVVCREDAPLKPDPAPLRLALDCLSEPDHLCERAWYVGDTPDDITAARKASLVPLAIAPPGADRVTMDPKLLAVGAARALDTVDSLEELLP
ncbi:MAG: aminotransferase class I/II-fold pyridoxal phosphate-dependent enzyme [Myxococcales bacterium FL481]|nr:MAG: aminotransferase class I/II-fold pyridoxal phosphate-dependent enzyme [Myxococcales bacterium FL481]